jgi:hypothetical protein
MVKTRMVAAAVANEEVGMSMQVRSSSSSVFLL